MSVLAGWFDRILGRKRADAGDAQGTTAEVREGRDLAEEPVTADELEEGAAAARDHTIAKDAPAQPPGAG